MIKWVTVVTVALFPFLTMLAGGRRDTAVSDSLTMRDIFANLHTPGLETIRKSARLDMTDYWEADSVHKVVTLAGGAAWLEEMTSDYLRVRVSPVSTVELSILPIRKSGIIACVYTVGDSIQARDSEVNFYDEQLRPLDKRKYFTAPDLSQFFDIPKDSPTTMNDLREMIPFPTVAYSLEAGSQNMTARLTVEDYVSPDDVPTIKKYLRKQLTAPWKGRYKFR